MLQEKLNELIRIFHERRIVERMENAETAKDRRDIYEEEKWMLQPKLFRLQQQVLAENEAKDSDEGAIANYDILPQDAIQVGVICIMAGIDDCQLFQDYAILVEALEVFEEEVKESSESYTAREMAYFLDINEAGQLFSDYETDDLLKRFFG